MNNYIIKTKNIKKRYLLGKTYITALKDITLNVKKGEFVIIAGPSGSGKSTLLHLWGCLDIPTEGTISISGKDINKLNDNYLSDFRANHIGFVFQSFNLLPNLTVKENVEYQLLLRGIPRKKRDEMVFSILNDVELEDYYKRFPNELSGGQRQRVAIARALVGKPELLIADEPTANLDSKTGDMIIELLISLSRQKSTSLIISTHDRDLIKKGDRVVMIKDGYVESDSNERE